jgi:hypothetical protein
MLPCARGFTVVRDRHSLLAQKMWRLSASGYRVACVLGFMLFFAICLRAQPVTELFGIVYVADNVPLADVTVELTFGKLHLTQATGPDGRFLFCCLPEGQFEIFFHHREASTAGEFTLTLARAKPSHVIVELETGSAKGWHLREDPSYGDVPDTSARTYTQANIARLPSALHLWALLGHTEVSATVERFDVAGMHGDDAMLFGSRGGSWSQNRVVWNGFNVTSGDGARTLLLPDLAAVADTTYDASSAGISPSGAVVLLEPRKGESSLHGEGHIFFQSGALQNVNVTPRLRSFGITESDERYRYFAQGNAQLGGPISSRWTYYGAASRLQTEKWIRNYLVPVSSTLTSETVHLLGDLSARDRLGLVWLGQQEHQPRGGANPQVASEATLDTFRDFQSLQGSWTHIVSPRSLLDARAAFSIGKTDTAFQSGTDKQSREELFPGFVDIPFVPSAENGRYIVAMLNNVWTGAAPLATASRDRRLEVRTQFHALRGGPRTSVHRLSFGFDLEWLQADERAHAFQNIGLRFFRGTPNSVKFFNASDAPNGSTRAQGYAVDNISIGSLSFSFSGQASRAWGSNQSANSEGNSLRWGNFGAHAGVGYRIGHRNPTLLRAAVAHRYEEALIRALKAVHPNGPSVSTYSWNDLNQDGAFQPGEFGRLTKVEGSAFSRLDPQLKQPYAREVHLEAARELPGRLVFSLHAFRRVEHNILALMNTGVPLSAYAPVEVFDPGDDGASQTGDEAWRVAYNQNVETLGQDAYLLTNFSHPRAFSEGYEAHVTKSGTQLEWDLAFTRYRAVARTAPGNGPLQNDWSVLAVINDPNQSINAYGSTFFDRGLGARFWGSWEPGWHMRLGWICSYLDGAPYGRILPVTGLNQGLLGILATRRGPGDGSSNAGKRTAHNFTTDLRLSRGFHLNQGRLDASLDVFNLFNSAHALREADVTSPAHFWRIPLSFQTPRSLQVGLHFGW